jgi:hypothetical protein
MGTSNDNLVYGVATVMESLGVPDCSDSLDGPAQPPILHLFPELKCDASTRENLNDLRGSHWQGRRSSNGYVCETKRRKGVLASSIAAGFGSARPMPSTTQARELTPMSYRLSRVLKALTHPRIGSVTVDVSYSGLL